MVEGVIGSLYSSVHSQGLAGIGVDVEAGKVAAGDVDADAVALLEDVGRGKGLDLEAVNLTRGHQLLALGTVAIAGAQDAVREVHLETRRETPRGRIDVYELYREVGVECGRGSVELDFDWSHDFDVEG